MLHNRAVHAAQQNKPFPEPCNLYFWRLQALLHCAMLRTYRDE
jgi:hypothetical protein